MPDSDHLLGQNLVDFRNEERRRLQAEAEEDEWAAKAELETELRAGLETEHGDPED